MANFPDDDLEVTFELALGADVSIDPGTWSWTDFTSRLVPDDLVSISRGVAVGSSNSATTFGSLTALNEDGALTPLLETSPYWPYIDVGTPARVRARPFATQTDTFNRVVTGAWGSGGQFSWSNGATIFNVAGGVGTWDHISRNANRVYRTDQVRDDTDLTFDASIPAVATGGSAVIGPTLRDAGAFTTAKLWAGLEFQTGGTVGVSVRHVFPGDALYTGDALVTVAGLTYSAGTMVRCRTLLVGDRIRVKAWLASGTEPGTWAIDIAVPHYEPGKVGIQSLITAINTNTLPFTFSVDNFTIGGSFFTRLEGYIADVRPTFLPTGGGTTWSKVQIDVAGIGSLAEKLNTIDESPMRRSVRTQVPAPLAYWPLEDAESSLSAASAFPGQNPMTVSGPAVFSFDQGTPTADYLSRYGTLPLVSLAAGASLQASFTPSTVATEWAVALVAEFYAPEVPAITELRVAEWRTPSGTHNRWALVAPVSGGYRVRAYNDNLGTATDVVTFTTPTFVGQATWVIEAHQNGGNIDTELFCNDISLATGSIAGTLAAPNQVLANPDKANTTNSVTPAGLKLIVGHVRVRDEITAIDTPRYSVPETGQTVIAINAWYLEPAHRRIKRLCEEELVPFQLVGAPTVSGLTLLNAQQPGSFTALLTAAADSESGGLLYEKRFGYYYLPRSIRYTPAVALTIDMSTYAYSAGTDPGQVLAPKLDARGANYWTVSRTNGSSAAAAAPAAFRKRRGTIDGGAELDVLTDDVLDDHASWRVHLNVDAQDANYPSIPIDLAANPALLVGWLACDIGSRVQRTNQPTIAGIGVVDQVVEGYTEKLGPKTWDVSANATPAKVWDIARYDDTAKRKDSRTSTLAAGYNTTATTMVVTFTNILDAWSTTATPYDWRVNGERVTVTAMGAVTGTGPYTQSATVTRSVNTVLRSHLVGEEVHMHPDQLARYAL
jgi:hypothetical protein